MTQEVEFGKVCSACGNANNAEAKSCAKCGSSLEFADESPDNSSSDDDLALHYVDANNRVALERFERFDAAELACGLLRSNGIRCELSPPALPGLPSDIILWVEKRDAQLAWSILADAERGA